MKTTMRQRILLVLMLCSFLFSGCRAAKPEADQKGLPLSPTDTRSAAMPSSTSTMQVASAPMIATPAPTSTMGLTKAAPTAAGSSTPTPLATASNHFLTPTALPVALPFHDCGRTPGLTSCDPSAPRLAGQVAFYDEEQSRLIGVDLKTGQGWSVPIPKPVHLEWSPDGSQLLVWMNYPGAQFDLYEYLVFTQGGKLIRQTVQEKPAEWQSQGAVLYPNDQPKIARSPDGAEAWLERTPEGKILHFRASDKAAWKTAALDMRPMEFSADLYGWLPGTLDVIISQPSGISTVSDVMTGRYLYLFNTQTGELRFLKKFNGHLNSQFVAFQKSNMAIIQMYQGLFNDTLAILDGKTGDISYPLPRVKGEVQPYSLLQISWQPGQNGREGLFALMVQMTRTNIPVPPPVPLFPRDGIYLYDRVSGQSQIVRELPENMIGGNFYWTADGTYLLYSIGKKNTNQKSQTILYLRQINTGNEWQIINHLQNPTGFISSIAWNLIAIFME